MIERNEKFIRRSQVLTPETGLKTFGKRLSGQNDRFAGQWDGTASNTNRLTFQMQRIRTKPSAESMENSPPIRTSARTSKWGKIMASKLSTQTREAVSGGSLITNLNSAFPLAFHLRSRLLPLALKRGFTLTELLVVIAIIAMLAALLSPGLKAARDSAKSIVCMNKVRQISTAFYLYAAENEGRFPAYHRNAGGNVYWHARLRRYLSYNGSALENDPVPKPDGFYKCPVDKRLEGSYALGPEYRGSYGIAGLNGIIWGLYALPDGSFLRTWDDPVDPSSFKNLAETYMLCDHDQIFCWSSDLAGASVSAFRHKNGANVLFMDGHMAWISRASFSTNGASTFWSGY